MDTGSSILTSSVHRKYDTQYTISIEAVDEGELAQGMRPPPDPPFSPHYDLLVKVLAALRMPGIDVHDVVPVHAHGRYVVELMEQWTSLTEDEAESDLSFAPRWTSSCSRLTRSPAGSTPPTLVSRGLHSTEIGLLSSRCRSFGGEWGQATSMLELRRVSKVYGAGATEVHALKDINLSVEAGTLVAVMGASGSGKSTLLTVAGSLEEPTSGDVVVGGASLLAMTRNTRARLRRRSIGYVFQDDNLLGGLSAAGNVALPLEIDGIPARKAHAIAMESLDELSLADRASHYPDELSGGERQKGVDRPGRGGRSPSAVGRRALGSTRLDQRRRGDAPPAGRVSSRRGLR